MIILSALSFTTSYHISTTWRFALHLLSLSICQRSLRTIHNSQFIIHNYFVETSSSGSGNPRAWTSVPGRIPSFLYLYIYIYRDKRIAARATRAGANLAGPNDVRPIINIFRKEVFQPHLPVRLPCYDLAPITSFALGRSSR